MKIHTIVLQEQTTAYLLGKLDMETYNLFYEKTGHFPSIFYVNRNRYPPIHVDPGDPFLIKTEERYTWEALRRWLP